MPARRLDLAPHRLDQPCRALNSVLFPAPFRPISATRSPASLQIDPPQNIVRFSPESSSTHRSRRGRAGEGERTPSYGLYFFGEPPTEAPPLHRKS